MTTPDPPPVAWLPGLQDAYTAELRHEGATVAGASFYAPRLPEADAMAVANAVRSAALGARRTRDTRDVIRAAAAAAGRLADPGDAHGRAAASALGRSGGTSTSQAVDALRRSAAGWTAEALEGIVRSELGSLDALDGPFEEAARPGRRRRVAGPPLLHVILAGNVPGVAVTAVIRGLLVRSGLVCKLPSAEPWLVGLFARALNEEDPDLAATVAATWWPGGDPTAASDAWTKQAGKVVVYGDAAAIRGLRMRTPPHVPLVEYGPRIGAVILGAGVSDEELYGLARDVCAYDQAGCVSPRLVYLLSDLSGNDAGGSAADVLSRLGETLSKESDRRGGGPYLSDPEAVAIRSARARYGFEESGARSSGPSDLAWTILHRPGPGAASEPLPRVLWAYEIGSVRELAGLRSVLENRLQAIGIGGLSAAERRDAEELAIEFGVSRVSPLGAMAWPPPDWRHDGRLQLVPLLRWTDCESGEGRRTFPPRQEP